MPHGPSLFQSTVVKPYYKDNSFKPLQDVLKDVPDNILEDIPKNIPKDIPEDVLKENYNQHALKGNYNSNTIVVDIL